MISPDQHTPPQINIHLPIKQTYTSPDQHTPPQINIHLPIKQTYTSLSNKHTPPYQTNIHLPRRTYASPDKHTPPQTNIHLTAVQGLRFSCYSWAPRYHSWTREPRHPVHVTDVYAAESRTPLVRELSADCFSVGLLLHCSPPSRVRAGEWVFTSARFQSSAIRTCLCSVLFNSKVSQYFVPIFKNNVE